MNITYINIKENGEFDYNDGFCCGVWANFTREKILSHFEDGWYNEKDVWIGDKKNPKAKYAREQWLKIADEIESGNIKPGWFRKSDKKVAAKIEKFRSSMRKIGYEVDNRIVERISKAENVK